MKRLFRRDDGRVCILAPVPSNAPTTDVDINKRGHLSWKQLSMLCGGLSWIANEEKGSAIPTCIRCLAVDYEPGESVDGEN